MVSNMSTDVSFLRLNRSALGTGRNEKEGEEEFGALCVEEAVDQKPLALESVTPDGKIDKYILLCIYTYKYIL